MKFLQKGIAILLALAASASMAAGYEQLYSQAQLSDSFDNCRELFPAKINMRAKDVDSRWKAKELCSDNFAVIYSGLSKTPIAVIERLSRESLSSRVKRKDDFFEDPRVKSEERSLLQHYKGSGMDRGHMANAADQPTERAMLQSMALTNMVPQFPENNQITWNKIESDVRKYTMRASGYVYVISGPLFQGTPRFLKDDPRGPWVPTSLFKLVYDGSTQRAWAYFQDNGPGDINRPVSYEEFRKRSGWKFLDAMPVSQ